MNSILLFLLPFITAFIVFFLDKLFNFKVRLIKFCGSIRNYKIIVLLIALFLYGIFAMVPILVYHGSSHWLTYNLLAIYFYLMFIPKEFR